MSPCDKGFKRAIFKSYCRGSKKLPGIVGSLYSLFHNAYIIIICKFSISLDIIFRGFNETRNQRKFGPPRIIIPSKY